MGLAYLDAKKSVGEAAAKKNRTPAFTAKIALSAFWREEFSQPAKHRMKRGNM